jgi:hypothetical protein
LTTCLSGTSSVPCFGANDRRAEAGPGYFICGFCGDALPFVGVGILSTMTSTAAAIMAFAAWIICFAVLALRFGFKRAR